MVVTLAWTNVVEESMPTVDLPLPEVPADIGIVRDLVNTTDLETQSDDLTTPAELTSYLYGAGLMPKRSRATADDLALARLLRSGLRRALELNHDGSSAPIPELEAALAELPLALAWTGDQTTVVTRQEGVRGGLAEVALAMQRAVADGIWWRLKVCASDECEWAYYDHSKNRSRSWCEYGCGNRIKMQAYRRRQKARRA
jgi:predicted RNA-binding Zn ribbon-like protein